MSPEKPTSRRRRRRWPILIGGVLLGGALVVATLFVPAVQAWLVRRIVARQPGWHVNFERFGVGLDGLAATGLDFAMPGLTARSAPISIEVLPSRFLHGELNLNQIEVRQLRVTLTPAALESAHAAGPAAPFAGVLALLRAPLPWVVGDAKLDAEFVVNDSGHSVVVSRLTLRGGHLSAGHPGEFTYELSASSSLLDAAPDNVLRSRGTLRVTQNSAHSVERLELSGDFILPRYGSLALPPGKFEFVLATATGGESYRATVQFDRGGSLDFRGRLDAPHTRLDGELGFRVDQTLVATLAGGRLPGASFDGKLNLALDLQTHALDATLDTALAGRDWQRGLPQLAVVDALAGKLEAAIAIRNGKATVTRATLNARGVSSPFALQAALTAPLPLTSGPPVAQGTLSIAHLPAAWANPWLGSSVQLVDGEFSGDWSFAPDANRAVRLSATRPAELGPVTLAGPQLPSLPAFTLRFSPRISASTDRLAFVCNDLVVTSTQDDRLALDLSAALDVKAQSLHITGDLAGALPSLFASPEHALPFTLGARWDATQSPSGLLVSALEFTARRAGQPEPALALALQAPTEFGTPDELQRQRHTDLLKFQVHDLPLAWISRWLKNQQLTGMWAAGESILRRADTGRGFTVVTPVPWTLTGLGFATGGKTLFTGRAGLAPEFDGGDELSTLRLRDLALADDAGNRVSGETTVAWRESQKQLSTALALDASLPALPGSAGTFGALTASLRTQASVIRDGPAQVENFNLAVRNPAGPLLSVASPEPLVFAINPGGELVFTSHAPLAVDVARLPLVWLQPWLPADAEIAGTLEPATLALTAEPERFLVRAPQPIRIAGFGYSRHGVPRVVAADGRFSPGVEVKFIYRLQPKFELGYEGRLRADDGALDVAGARAIDFHAELGFIGDDRRIGPAGGELGMRVDFAALHRVPVLAENGMPAGGELTLQLDSDLLHAKPTVFHAALSGVPAVASGRILPPLEIAAQGRAGSQPGAIRFDVAARFATTPQPSDAAFHVEVALGKKTFPLDSALRSKFFDAGEFLALANAFAPPHAPAPVAVAAEPLPAAATAPLPPSPAPSTAPHDYPPLGAPFWGQLRGHFDLDLGAIQFAPYRIDAVRGRLDLTDRALTLGDFTGQMFAGRWDGGLHVDYDPAEKTADHAFDAHFRIAQLATARAIQTVFPNDFGSLDTQLDLDARLHGSGSRWWQLLDDATGEFTVDARGGVARLTYPQLGAASTVLALAGTLSFSPEMRALGRLLKAFSEMPLNDLRVAGRRDAAGDLVLSEFRLDSPQARFLGRGEVPAVTGVPLAARHLDLSMQLEARDDMAVLLGNMKLLDKKPLPDGYRRMNQPFTLGGEVGKPDPSALYEMLARAVDGSKGTWSLIMRKVQKEIEKQPPPAPPKTAALP